MGARGCTSTIDQLYPPCTHCVNEILDQNNFELIEGNYHLVSGKSGARSNNPNKYRDDALILETAYDEAQKNKDDIMVRYSFYCAQS